MNSFINKRGEAEVLSYSNVVIKPNGNVLSISYKEGYTKNDANKKYYNKMLYRIKLHKNFNQIKIFKNGKETQFNNIYL